MSAWGASVSVPVTVLETLVVAEATSSAHHNLCNPHSKATSNHPGDPLGKVLSWLWSVGREMDCVELVTAYLAEMREHNPHHPQVGDRLTLEELLLGIRQSLDWRLGDGQSDELIGFLRDRVPRFYGAAPKRLNVP